MLSPIKSTTRNANSYRRQVYELIDIMSAREVPLLKLVGIDGEPGKNPKFEWLEDTLLAETSAVAAGDGTIVGNAANTTANVTSGDGVNFQAGMVIRVYNSTNGGSSATYEYMYVSAVTTDALTVVRNIDGVGALANIAASDPIDIVSVANFEDADSPLKGTNDFTIPFNYFQSFDTSYKITYMADKTDVYGVPQGDDERELQKAFEEIAIKLERAAFIGHRRNVSGTSYPRLMGGLDFYLAGNNGGAVDSWTPVAYTSNLSSAQLQEKHISDMLQNRWSAVGAQNMGKTLLVGGWNKRRINDFYAGYVKMDRQERTGGVKVDTIDTDWGPIDVLVSLRCPASRVYLVNLDYIAIHPYRELAFFDEEKASSGAYTIRQIYGVYTMSVRNSKGMGVLYGTATS